ncbi:hypothetical protein [Corynebacterium auriscanis]|uniref:hypothetical protein n=1 Tax=Corynebacterium auriscanis TaxID=99807 RepID=UPI0025B552E4|nr:hypothetical protein [Corynebacterium auriscanis]WJY72497.1 hypothetical protein CAURIC_04240 [Corynebacterium auriscanis]
MTHKPGSQDAYHWRRSQAIVVNKRRRRQLDWEDTRKPAWVAWLSGVCTIALLLTLLALGATEDSTAPIANGDRLGPFDTSRMQYKHQAQQRLAEAQGDEPRWALVLADKPWTSDSMAKLLSDVETSHQRLRVSTVYAAGSGLLAEAVGEPAIGHTRADVFANVALDLAGENLRVAKRVVFDAMLVYGKPDTLRALSQRVFSVEPAPVDAVYGKIGVRTQALDQ